MARRQARASDLLKLWLIELVVIVGAVYSSIRQASAELCGVSGSDARGNLFECFTGSLARMVLPWAVGGSILIGCMALILSVVYVLGRRSARPPASPS